MYEYDAVAIYNASYSYINNKKKKEYADTSIQNARGSVDVLKSLSFLITPPSSFRGHLISSKMIPVFFPRSNRGDGFMFRGL